jgi:hypothetical protein
VLSVDALASLVATLDDGDILSLCDHLPLGVGRDRAALKRALASPE